MNSTTIYHGTPITPRAALLDVCAGRALCVSFFRPDDVEAAEAISPAIMFRQRGVLGMACCSEGRRRVVHPEGLGAVLRLAGAATVPTWSLGRDTGRPRRTFPAQRHAAASLAFRRARRSPLAHGWPDRAASQAVRPLSQGLLGLDRGGKAPGSAGLSRQNGRGRQGLWEPLARGSHDARRCSGRDVPFRQRGRHIPCAERVAL